MNNNKIFIKFFMLIRQHPHSLKYETASEKGNPAYMNGWGCDDCGNFHPGTQSNLFCTECGYDICEKCFDLDN